MFMWVKLTKASELGLVHKHICDSSAFHYSIHLKESKHTSDDYKEKPFAKFGGSQNLQMDGKGQKQDNVEPTE